MPSQANRERIRDDLNTRVSATWDRLTELLRATGIVKPGDSQLYETQTTGAAILLAIQHYGDLREARGRQR